MYFVIFYNFESFLVCNSTLVMTRILIGVISMSGLTRGSLVVISNMVKKVDEDVRNYERAKADRAGRDKGTDRE